VANIVDWSGTKGGVEAVTSMSTFQDGPFRARATSSLIVVLAGATFITLSKGVAGILCLAGAWRMWRAHRSAAEDFQQAKNLALIGCSVAALLFFGGFVVIAEGWFEMWRSSTLGSSVGAAAFRYFGAVMLVAIFIQQPEKS
jgi:predicted small integral membrane protein